MLTNSSNVTRFRTTFRFDGWTVPLRPTTLRRMQSLISPTIQAAGVVELATHDPGLAFHLLRLANSTGQEAGSPVHRLEEAIFFVGREEIRDLISTQDQLRHAEAIEMLGAHSRLTALLARRMAELTGEGDPTRAYIAGLLHDLGKLALIAHGSSGSHSSVGRELATGAALPSFMIDVISNHHRPEAAEVDAQLVCLISVADQVARGIAETKASDRTAATDMLRSGLALFQKSDPSTLFNCFSGMQWFPLAAPNLHEIDRYKQ